MTAAAHKLYLRDGTPVMTLTVTEAAAIVRVNRRTMMNWCRAGKVTAYQTPGGHWRIDEAEIERLRAGK